MREFGLYVLVFTALVYFGVNIESHEYHEGALDLPYLCTQGCKASSEVSTTRYGSMLCRYNQQGNLESVIIDQNPQERILYCFVEYSNYKGHPLKMNVRLENGVYMAYDLTH